MIKGACIRLLCFYHILVADIPYSMPSFKIITKNIQCCNSYVEDAEVFGQQHSLKKVCQ